MSVVAISESAHHLYVTFLVPAWRHADAARDLRGMGARYQPAAGRWEVANTAEWHDRLERWAASYFEPGAVLWPPIAGVRKAGDGRPPGSDHGKG